MKQLLLKRLMVTKKTEKVINIDMNITMKDIILPIITFFCVFISLEGQDRLDFGILQQNHLYVNEFSQKQKSFCFLKTELDVDTIKRTCGNFYFNSLIDFRDYGWDIKGNEYVSVAIEYRTRLPSGANIKFMQKEVSAISFKIPPVGHWVRLEEMRRKYREGIYWPTGLDITVANDTIWLLHRRNKAIDMWFGKPVMENGRQNYSWEHNHTYLADSLEVTKQFSYEANRIVPISARFSSTSIPKSLIRYAKLILVKQSEYFFVINLSHGEIYYLGEKIELVGYLDKEDKPWIKNHRERAMLIEDRDNGVLITAQSVRRLLPERPFPKFEQMKD